MKDWYKAMAVKEIEYYTQKDGREILKVILNPTKKYPNGYFYVDRYFEELVRKYTWFIVADRTNDYVKAGIGSVYRRTNILLHQEIAYRCLSYYPKYLDHKNHVGIDNICNNLTEVTQQQNNRNKQTKGYGIGKIYKSGSIYFQPTVTLNRDSKHDKSIHREDDACQNQFYLEAEYYSDYNYDFLADRRNDLDIVDLERTGQISSEEATFQHVMRYAKENAWYIFRYNLEDYFKAYNIPLPAYSLNTEGRMVHHITGELLCPFG